MSHEPSPLHADSGAPTCALGGAAERGSVFVIVLFVLLALTIIGISLTLVTQTEIFIGGSEKASTRTLYAADSAIRVQLGSTLLNNDQQPRTLQLGQRTLQGSQVMEDRVDISPFYPTYTGTCPACMVNQDSQYFAVNFVVSALAERGWQDPARDDPNQLDTSAAELDDVVAAKTVGSMFALQPQPSPSLSSFQESTQTQIDGIRK